MSGTSSLPSIAVAAEPEPVRPANTVPPATDMSARRPGRRPNHVSSTSIIRLAMPERNITSPMTTNSGTATIEKCVTESEIESTSWSSPAAPFQKR